jgi:hypothetical protein
MSDLLLGLFITSVVGLISWHYFKYGKVDKHTDSHDSTNQVLPKTPSPTTLQPPTSNLPPPQPQLPDLSDLKLKIEAFETDYERSSVLYKKTLDEISQHFSQNLNQTITQVSQSISEAAKHESAEHNKTTVELQKQLIEWQADTEEEIKYKLNSFLETFETNMSQFFIGAEQKSLESINLELKSARALIESYKTQQLGIIEENIVAVLERTLSIVLKQKLSLKDQLDLVYEALEKAKVEKFLV